MFLLVLIIITDSFSVYMITIFDSIPPIVILPLMTIFLCLWMLSIQFKVYTGKQAYIEFDDNNLIVYKGILLKRVIIDINQIRNWSLVGDKIYILDKSNREAKIFTNVISYSDYLELTNLLELKSNK